MSCEVIFSIFCIIVLSIWVLVKIDGVKQNKTFKEENKKVVGRSKLDKFFIECVLSKCNDFTKEKNVEKAKLFADKYHLLYPSGIETLYKEGLKAHGNVSEDIVSKKLAEQREMEEKEYNELTKYSDLYGKAKRIAMLTDRMNELLRRATSLDNQSDMLMRSTQQHESNWGIWGGIADGLAGPAAGISMAMDVQAQNAKIRAQNEANMKAAAPLFFSYCGSASECRANAKAIQKEINSMKEKLISDMPSEEVMKLLEVSNSTVDVSETGAYKITATIAVKEKLYIYDDVKAIADGTIIAHLYQDNIEIGTAKLVLPVNGVKNKVGIVGVGLFGAEKGKNYSLKFTAHKLWLIEE